MRFLISVIDTSSGSGTIEETAAIDVFNAKLNDLGKLLMAIGLKGPDDSFVIDGRGKEVLSRAGLNSSDPEYQSGFWIIDARDKSEALEIAVEASKSCNRKVELREFF